MFHAKGLQMLRKVIFIFKNVDKMFVEAVYAILYL